MIVDSHGLAIERSGDFESAHAGLISSIMKNVAQLSQVLSSHKSR